MLKSKLKYLPLIVFLVSVLMIVFLQFNSGQSINTLINSNTRLLNELKTQRDLQILETAIVSVESNVRGAVITERSDHLKNLEGEIHNIRLGLKKLDIYFDDPVTDSLMKSLNIVVERKITHSTKVIKQYKQFGKDSAEEYINQNRGKSMTDSIVLLIDKLTNTRQAFVKTITDNIAENGKKARSRGMFLAIVAAVSSIFAFFYIIAISRKQQKLIAVLNESEKKEKESARVKDQFLSNMSHEIRTPLNAILGFTNLLSKTALSPVQKEYVTYMRSSGQNLQAIVNDILDLSKIEAGMMRIEKTSFHFPDLIMTIDAMFREKAQAKGIVFDCYIDENIPVYLTGDSFRLTQVLTNLLGNAIKFTESGKIELMIHLNQKNPEQVILVFEISDTGVGIDQHKLDIIFDRFQQAEMDTTRKFGGTGLGLSIVKQLVLLKNGHIEVNSKKGKGTSFKVFLPFGLEAPKIEKGNIKIELPTSSQHKKAHILVAEDNEMNQQLLKHLLIAHHFSFEMVSNGNDAVKKLSEKKFDIVLMDIQMPGKDGYETTRLVRNELHSNIPIVAMTAYAFPGDKEKCLSAGFDDYITKPIREQELINVIFRNIGEKKNKTQLLVNTDYLNELSGGDVEFREMLLRQFEIQLPQELDELENAIILKNRQQVHRIAHSLKSTLGYVGLYDEQVSHLLEKMESEAENSSGESMNAFFEFKELCLQALSEIS